MFFLSLHFIFSSWLLFFSFASLLRGHCGHLGLWYLAQGYLLYLSSHLPLLPTTSQVLSTLGLELRILCFLAQAPINWATTTLFHVLFGSNSYLNIWDTNKNVHVDLVVLYTTLWFRLLVHLNFYFFILPQPFLCTHTGSIFSEKSVHFSMKQYQLSVLKSVESMWMWLLHVLCAHLCFETMDGLSTSFSLPFSENVNQFCLFTLTLLN